MSEGKLKNLWVLFVDDEADARTMVSFILQMNGARVTTANSAVEALEILTNADESRNFPDVIISDIGMPNESDYALIEKIRARPSKQSAAIPAIALTGFNRPEDKQNALDAGFQIHIGKPFDLDYLVAAVADLADHNFL
ncbi:MAG: response regulator [Pyrinomonadaceae bacterium]